MRFPPCTSTGFPQACSTLLGSSQQIWHFRHQDRRHHAGPGAQARLWLLAARPQHQRGRSTGCACACWCRILRSVGYPETGSRQGRPRTQFQIPLCCAGGFLAKLFGGGGKGRVTTPLTEPLEGVNLPLADPPLIKQPTTEVTTLDNGLKVASEATPVSNWTLNIFDVSACIAG